MKALALKDPIAQLFSEECALFSFAHEHITTDLDYFDQWIEAQAHGSMAYLAKHTEARRKVELILPNAQSALLFLFPYAYGKNVRPRLPPVVGRESSVPTKQAAPDSLIGQGLISKYVYGKDYHKTIKKTLHTYAQKLRNALDMDFDYRPIVDSAPFLERAHARQAGLGFVGKNTVLIRPGMGSFFFIASLLTTLPGTALAAPAARRAFQSLDCGLCQKCLDACPTGALEKPYFLNANKCLSYLSIEHRDTVAKEFLPHFAQTLYGCDICQDVCPYNLVTLNVARHPDFAHYHSPFLHIGAWDVALMTPTQYEQWFGGSAATRARYGGLVRNALYHLYATGHPRTAEACRLHALGSDALAQAAAKQVLGYLSGEIKEEN